MVYMFVASGKVHIIGGLILTSLILIFFYSVLKIQWIDLPVIGVIVFMYAQLPDIDHKMSHITWLNLILGIILIWIGYFTTYNTTILGNVIVTIIVFTAWKLPHRGPTHTIWFVIGSPFLLLLLPKNIFSIYPLIISAAIACYSHLLLDGYWFKLSLKSKRKDFTINT